MESTTSQSDRHPDEESVELSITSKPMLTIKRLGEMIISSMDKQYEQDKDDNRLFQFKRILINYLFNGIATRIEDKNSSKVFVPLPLTEDENLILYTFFISENNQFNFEWSYLLSKIDKIEGFLLRFKRYINFICSDISELIQHISFESKAIFRIDDFLKVSYIPKYNELHAEIILKEFPGILNCKEDCYTLKILYQSKTAISLNRTSKINVKNASKNIETLINIIAEDNQQKIEDIKTEDDNK